MPRDQRESPREETPGDPQLGRREGSSPPEQRVVHPPAHTHKDLTLPAGRCPSSPQPVPSRDAPLARQQTSTRGGRASPGRGWWDRGRHGPAACQERSHLCPGAARGQRARGGAQMRYGPVRRWSVPRRNRPREGRGTNAAPGTQGWVRSRLGRVWAAKRGTGMYRCHCWDSGAEPGGTGGCGDPAPAHVPAALLGPDWGRDWGGMGLPEEPGKLPWSGSWDGAGIEPGTGPGER